MYMLTVIGHMTVHYALHTGGWACMYYAAISLSRSLNEAVHARILCTGVCKKLRAQAQNHQPSMDMHAYINTIVYITIRK